MAQARDQELVDRFETFFRRYESEAIADLARQYPREKKSLPVDWDDLFRFDPDFADEYLEKPTRFRDAAEEALGLYDLPVDVELADAHVRLYNLPEVTEIREIRAEHLGTLISVRGIVRKATSVKPKIQRAAFECLRCSTRNVVPQSDGGFQDPYQCEGCEREGPFQFLTDAQETEFIDSQKLRIQESPEGLGGGETPESIDMHVEDDITGEVSPGDHVVATGVLELDESDVQEGESRVFDMYLDGVSIEVEDEEFEEMEITDDEKETIIELSETEDIYERIIDSIAPSIYGFPVAKLAIALQMFSGVTKQLPDGARIRGDIHILLVGDPGTGKSQLLQYIRHVSPRSVYTSGKGSSSAGLTAAAVRDDFGDGQQWSLEAGALVLADKGVAAIDELDKMAPDDRSAMHQALEQQEISISKAGINATLKSRCALLGAANPELGRFDRYEPPAEQIDLEPALISRFDLIFTVSDEPDEEKDENLAEHILQSNYAGELYTHRSRVSASTVSDEEIAEASQEVQPAIQPELLRKYVAYARSNCFPTMTDEAETHIRDFYVDLRSQGTGEDAPVPVTARKLEAIVRLAEASARVRLSDTVEIEDAERALDIVETTLREIGMDPETGKYDADVIETGQSKSQRDRIRTIRQLIAEIEDEFSEGAPIEEVLARAEEVDMDREKAEHEIDKLKKQGEVYEPTTDHLRTT
ncbi:MAG: minichromosome maintenance protein MCM [Halodesulfurarchaeum sp.]